METTYRITGMTCGHCEGAVKEELSALPEVKDVKVSAAEGTAVVTSEAALDDAAIRAAVDEAGYEVVTSD
ncbi:heavy-metal-associated domain-containing protein [Natronoglycomyces albus]|uniref:Heavy-metal-associated domain-containing protein n=1 Tax=Natronoglycomyces albus TaxID=2811108 RepID=A0A895XQV6_9ACTN|nr:heavy metal-associated domain-containing protein [Natronoglycomyces albus]QSB05545.1 heavy-metal-associated domain-containing protein [Natronoglycomyces albus]